MFFDRAAVIAFHLLTLSTLYPDHLVLRIHDFAMTAFEVSPVKSGVLLSFIAFFFCLFHLWGLALRTGANSKAQHALVV